MEPRQSANQILRRVDHLIKSGDIDESMREVIRAKEIDPSNFYILAYEERLAYLKQEHEKNIQQELTRKQAEQAARLRDAELRVKQEEERQQKSELSVREPGAPAKSLRRPAVQAQIDVIDNSNKQMVASPSVVTPEKVYAEAFAKAWSSGKFTPEQGAALQKLRRELGISHGRQVQIASEVLANLQSGPSTKCILVIDDDEEILLVVSHMLTFNGFDVIALTTSDEALVLLKRWKPRLILSDINLQTSSMGGFTFYEKIREMDRLADVPFVFLSGLGDDILVRKGKEMGVDDYLIKPVSEGDLIATVKGKLKRFG